MKINNAKVSTLRLSNGTWRAVIQSQGYETACTGPNEKTAVQNALAKFNQGVRVENIRRATR